MHGRRSTSRRPLARTSDSPTRVRHSGRPRTTIRSTGRGRTGNRRVPGGIPCHSVSSFSARSPWAPHPRPPHHARSAVSRPVSSTAASGRRSPSPPPSQTSCARHACATRAERSRLRRGTERFAAASRSRVVDRQGFTQRPDRFGTGSLLSYGLVLRDTSAGEDAQNVYVIVNMVAASGELIGSKSQTVPLVPAGGTFALGDSLSLRTQVAATRLEITVRVGAHEPKQDHTMPEFANVRILPSSTDPGWVAEVDAEIVNVDTPKTLSSANVSLVIVDAAGNRSAAAATRSRSFRRARGSSSPPSRA